MSRSEWAVVVAANLAVAGTGVVYAVMRYLLEPADEFAVVNHPLEPHVQHLHVLAGPWLVFVVGLVWHGHVRRRLAGPGQAGRLSGTTMVLAFVPLVLSGGLIQVSVEPGWRRLWVGVHLGAAALWLGGWVLHPLWRRFARTGEPSRVGAASPPRVSAAGSAGCTPHSAVRADSRRLPSESSRSARCRRSRESEGNV